MLYLNEVTKENWIDIIRLSSAEDQKNKVFEKTIASNCLSLAQASLYENWVVKSIYSEKILVGFTMYGYSDELGGYELCRLMIDYRFQGKGYGKESLELIVGEMERTFQCKEVLLCVQPDNTKAIKLYTSFGFEDTGRTIRGNVDEHIYLYNLDKGSIRA